MKSLTVVKLGGSLFTLPDLASRLNRLFDPSECYLIVTGGGAFADEIRRMDQQWVLGERASHRLALQSMSLTASVVARLLNCPGVRSAEEFMECSRTSSVIVADCEQFESVQQLPESWDVTSDSIAAAIAVELHAETLHLLKSTDTPVSFDLQEWADLGLVDAMFPTTAKSLPRIRWTNLRVADASGECHGEWQAVQ